MYNILRQSTDWKDFKSRLNGQSEKRKGDCFELLVKHFLQLDPTLATKLKHVWLRKDVPAKVRRHLRLPDSDEGIDLIAETKEGEYWAIQAKFKTDESGSVTRKELSTFTDLAFGICKNVSVALACTTADRYSHKLKLHDRVTFCCGDVWRGLDKGFFQRLRKLLAGRTVALRPLQPRPHQRRAVRSAHLHFAVKRKQRGKLIWPCGTGKSLAAYWIAQKLRAKIILVAVPSLYLVRQALRDWATESVANRREINWICVCSDPTVKESGESEETTVLVQDLHVDVHTDPDEIAAFLRRKRRGTTVVFTTYQSGKAVAKAARKAKTTFDLGIMDEAHKTVGLNNSLFGYLLHDKNIRIKKRIFMTATERHYQGQSDRILSMDDPDIYGETFDLLTFKQALQASPPILSDYQVVTMLVTRQEVADLVRRNLFVQPDKGRWNGDVESQVLAAVIALRKTMKTRPIQRAVSFHNSIARAVAFRETQEAFSAAFPRFGKLETFHVRGAMPTAVRSRYIEEFSVSKRGLITNARCLAEGVDVPGIDCVLFADARRSTVDIVQAVGRALRLAKGKRRGYVVLPVLVDTRVKSLADVEDETFKEVISVLRSLASQDERIVEYFRSISQGRNPRGGRGPIDFDIPIGRKIDMAQFVESIQLKFWSRLAKLSWRPFDEARKFVHKLRLSGKSEWERYYKGNLSGKNPKPDDIPTNAREVYREKGWKNWGDWLGTGTLATQNRQYRSFDQARAFVRELELKSQEEWLKYCKGKLRKTMQKPDDIPADPREVYKDNGWKGMRDWLGIKGFRKGAARPFQDARAFVHKLRLTSVADWRMYCNGKLSGKKPKPDDIPTNAARFYRGRGWTSWGDWIGTGSIASYNRKYRSFAQARAFVHALHLSGQVEWLKYCNGELSGKQPKPDDIPSNPSVVYKDQGWKNLGDWLGTGRIANKERVFRPFEQARAFVHELQLGVVAEWWKYCNGELLGKQPKPGDIPSNPSVVYKGRGWNGMGDWLGTGTVAPKDRRFRPFKKARAFVRKLKLKSSAEWHKYCTGDLPEVAPKPDDIPSNPQHSYRDKGWKGMGDWLGTGTVAPFLRKYRSFKQARMFVRKLQLSGRGEWEQYCKGGLRGKQQKPKDIPAAPWHCYRDKGWKGLGDWLGV